MMRNMLLQDGGTPDAYGQDSNTKSAPTDPAEKEPGQEQVRTETVSDGMAPRIDPSWSTPQPVFVPHGSIVDPVVEPRQFVERVPDSISAGSAAPKPGELDRARPYLTAIDTRPVSPFPPSPITELRATTVETPAAADKTAPVRPTRARVRRLVVIVLGIAVAVVVAVVLFGSHHRAREAP